METIVNDFNKKADHKLLLLVIIEILLALLTLTFIFFEVNYVIKPAYINILKQNEAMQKIAWQQSHEVRRPLANILGLVDVLERNKFKTEQEKKMTLKYLKQSSNELDEIIHEIVKNTNANSISVD